MLDLREYFLTVLKEANLAASDGILRTGILGVTQKVEGSKRFKYVLGLIEVTFTRDVTHMSHVTW